MHYAFIFGALAVSVYPLRNPNAPEEGGARVDIQRVRTEPSTMPGAAAVVATLRELVWRADVFTDLGGEPGNWTMAHYHTGMYGAAEDPARYIAADGLLAGERHWDPGMQANALTWVQDQLRDLESTLVAANAEQLAATVDYDDYRQALPAINTALAACVESVVPHAAVPVR